MGNFKGLESVKETLKNLRSKRELTAYYGGRFFRVLPAGVKPVRGLSVVDAFIYDGGISQEFFDVNTELKGRDLADFARLNVEAKLRVSAGEFYIFAHLLKTSEVENNFRVSVSYFQKELVKEAFKRGVKAKHFLPIEFCLSNYCRQRTKNPSVFFLNRKEELIAVFSVDGYPFEVMRDVPEAGETSGREDIFRLLSYFNSAYSGLPIERVFVSGFEEPLPDSIIGTKLVKVSGEEFLKGAIENPYAVSVPSYYVEYAGNALTVLTLAVFLPALIYGSFKIVKEHLDLRSCSREFKDLSSSLTFLRKSLSKEAAALKVKRVEDFARELEVVSAVPPSLQKLSSVKERVNRLCRKYEGTLFVSEISLKGGKVIVKGKIVTDSRKVMAEVANSLRELFTNVKFSVNPPRPPFVFFSVEEHV